MTVNFLSSVSQPLTARLLFCKVGIKPSNGLIKRVLWMPFSLEHMQINILLKLKTIKRILTQSCKFDTNFSQRTYE